MLNSGLKNNESNQINRQVELAIEQLGMLSDVCRRSIKHHRSAKAISALSCATNKVEVHYAAEDVKINDYCTQTISVDKV